MVDPWTSNYVPPSVRLSRCELNDGVKLAGYDLFKKVLDWLYAALNTTWDVAREGIKVLNLLFPSQVALEVIKNWELNDFRIDEKKFWAIQFWVFGKRTSPIRLPKIQLSENFWSSLFAPLNVMVPGSEDWLFKDPSDEIIKFGHQHDPVRYYYLLSDGVEDMKQVALVTVILYILNKLGLFEAAKGVMKTAFNWYKNRSWKRDVDDTNDWLHYLFDGMINNGDTMGVVLDEHEDKLDRLVQKVGLKLILR